MTRDILAPLDVLIARVDAALAAGEIGRAPAEVTDCSDHWHCDPAPCWRSNRVAPCTADRSKPCPACGARREVTASDLTDEQIHEHLDWLTAQPYIGADQRRAIRDGIRYCAAALVPDGRRVVAIWWDARERVAASINARSKAGR